MSRKSPPPLSEESSAKTLGGDVTNDALEDALATEPTMTPTEGLVGLELGNGRYRIVGPLAEGGAGHIYRAIQDALGREVAVKVLRSDLSEVARQEFEPRFQREAELAGRLSHPNLVRVYDHGKEPDGTHYMVMEMLKGRSLLDRLRDEGPLSGEVVAEVASGVARGLHHAHEHGLVHRDVKTSNVMLVRDDRGIERPVLVDFGLAKPKKSEAELDLTTAGMMLGTPSFMSPEQCSGMKDVDRRSDIYGLGCVMYQLLTRKKPFVADTPFKLAVQHQVAPIPPMSERAPGITVDPALEEIVRRCMAKEPEDRYQTAESLADALDEWASPPLEVLITEVEERVTNWRAVGLAVLGGLIVGGGAAALAMGLSTGTANVPNPTPEAALVVQPAPLPAPAPAPVVQPVAEPMPVPAPEPGVAQPPAPDPAPAPRPGTKPKPAPSGPEPGVVMVREVKFKGAQADRALAIVNTQSKADLIRMGLSSGEAAAVVENRPYGALGDLERISGVSKGALQNLALAARQ